MLSNIKNQGLTLFPPAKAKPGTTTGAFNRTEFPMRSIAVNSFAALFKSLHPERPHASH